MLIPEDLYLDDVHLSERSFKRNSQYSKAFDEVIMVGDVLTALLIDDEIKLFRTSWTLSARSPSSRITKLFGMRSNSTRITYWMYL